MRFAETEGQESERGFNRIELFVIVATLALLATVTRPVWASAGSTKSLVCMENLRRLSAAWMLCADDNGGKFVGNYHGGFVPTPTGTERPWVTGWLDWTLSSDNTNAVYLTNPRYAGLAPYMMKDPSVFKCPADDYLSPIQAARGWSGRARSYSMNCAIGEGNLATGPVNPRVRQVTRTSDFGRLSPQRTFVFLDEHPDSLNDGLFWVPNSSVNTPDVPGSHHDGAGWFTFADGHLERHQWLTPQFTLPVKYSVINNTGFPAGNPDAQWLLDHTPQR